MIYFTCEVNLLRDFFHLLILKSNLLQIEILQKKKLNNINEETKLTAISQQLYNLFSFNLKNNKKLKVKQYIKCHLIIHLNEVNSMKNLDFDLISMLSNYLKL